MAKKAAAKTATTDAQLDTLNDLRRQMQLVPLNKTPPDIATRIAKLRERIAAGATTHNGDDATTTTTPEERPAKAAKPVKKSNASTQEQVTKEQVTKEQGQSTDGDVVTLGDICKRLDVEGRAARIRLRKAGERVPARVGDSWRWSRDDVAAVEAIIAKKGA